jgi:putative FmdB family regulatory protein
MRMPTYEYECADCGPFSQMVPMAAYDQDQACPDCGAASPRLLTLPAIGGMAASPDAGGGSAPAHAGGCSCCSAPRRFSAEAV